MKNKEKYSSKLLVEGNDDQHVLWSLCQFHKINETFDVVDCESIDNVFKRLAIEVNENSSRTNVVGIVVDADVNLEKQWVKIQHILNDCGNYAVPDSLPESGLILKPNKSNKPTVGVWIMPNNNINGMLEDFVSMLSEEGEPVMDAVDATLSHIEAQGINKYKEIHKAKAKIHTFLAWQEDPGTPMGLAITKKYLDPNSENCKPFIAWLNKLLNSY